MSRQSLESIQNNILYASYGCMKVADNPFVVQLHDMIQKHPATKYVNIGLIFGTLYKRERDPDRDKAIGLEPISAAQARLTATEYTMDILDTIAHNLGIHLGVVEMLPTLEDLSHKQYVKRKPV